MIKITKAQLRQALGPDTRDVDIATFFGISQSAVSQWVEDEPIPPRRALEALQLRPALLSSTEELTGADPLPAGVAHAA